MNTHSCPVCGMAAPLLDVVDLNKSCEEARGRFLPLSGVAIYYALCDACGFCFAPEFQNWTTEEFSARIYNDDYRFVDPDYVDARPRANAQMVSGMFSQHVLSIRHLDYGGGNGLLSNELFGGGWDSQSYDPFVDSALACDLGRFNLVTSFEVFEHVPDVNRLIATLASLTESQGVLLFSTLVSDGMLSRGQRLQWWYASPRNGHISLFSRKSLALLGAKEGFKLASVSPNLHMYWRELPSWASEFIAPG